MRGSISTRTSVRGRYARVEGVERRDGGDGGGGKIGDEDLARIVLANWELGGLWGS